MKLKLFDKNVTYNERGICGRVVKVVDFKPLSPHRCGFESQQGVWILSCEEAIQLAYGTSLVLLRCLFVPEIMHGRASSSKAGNRHMTYTVSVSHKTQSNKTNL
jgi:hypothetical protein